MQFSCESLNEDLIYQGSSLYQLSHNSDGEDSQGTLWIP